MVRVCARRGVANASSEETKALAFTNGAETSKTVRATSTGDWGARMRLTSSFTPFGSSFVFCFTAMVCVRRPAVTPGVASTTRSAASVSSASV